MSKQTRNIYSVRGNRSTRYAYVSLKESKEAKCVVEFLDKVIEFFPYKIHKLLTDNGKEFTGRFIRGRKTPSSKHIFDLECVKHNIEHRLTKPYPPKTNGMVERF